MNAADGYDAASNLLTGATAGTAFIVLVTDSTASANNVCWSNHDRSGAKCVTDEQNYGRLADGKVIDGSFYSVQPAAWTPPLNIGAAYHVLSVRVSANVYKALFDDVQQVTDNTGVFVQSGAQRFMENCNGDKNFTGLGGGGAVAEIIVYKAGLSNADMTTVYNYLKTKYGL